MSLLKSPRKASKHSFESTGIVKRMEFSPPPISRSLPRLNLTKEPASTTTITTTTTPFMSTATPVIKNPLFDLDYCVDQLSVMSGLGLEGGCGVLGSLLITVPALRQNHTNSFKVNHIFADNLYQKGEYERAEYYYRRAIQFQGGFSLEQEYEVRFKIYQCAKQRNDWRPACAVLEKIPSDSRSTKVNLALGQAYVNIGERRLAILSLKMVLRDCPLAIEIVNKLFSLGANEKELIEIIQPITVLIPWLPDLIKGYSCFHSHDYNGAILKFQSLRGFFGTNALLLIKMAECYWHIGKLRKCITAFEMVRAREQHSIDGIGYYANALRRSGLGNRINLLATSVLQTNRMRSEGWLAMAQYCQFTNENTQALMFADKAIQLEPRNAFCYATKGSIQLVLKDLHGAVTSFREAYSIRRDYVAYQGLVDCYLGLDRIYEAKQIALEAMKVMPKNVRAIALNGIVYLHTRDTWPEAKKMFERALLLDSSCVDALTGLVHLALVQKEYQVAIDLLTDQLAHGVTESLHTRLADALTCIGDYNEAINHYHKALRICPQYAPAKTGLDMANRLANGDRDQSILDQSNNSLYMYV